MAETATDYSSVVRDEADGKHSLFLAVEGMHCAGCAFTIEKNLNANPDVNARVNLTHQRVKIIWSGDAARGNALVAGASALGYKFSPITERAGDDDKERKFLLRCMAVSGFASGNIMIFSLALWFTNRGAMGGATADFMHWIMALIALPATVYAGLPFFRSAFRALSGGTTNMDVPISLAVILASAMSLFETIRHGEYVYFDSAVMLLFLLLCGRYLDATARGRARAAAGDLLSLMSGTATIIEETAQRRIPAEELKEGMLLLVAAGERILADGKVERGASDLDTSAITGETAPRSVTAGDDVLAGMVNASQPIEVRIERAGTRSLLNEITQLMEKAEQGNAAYVRLADKISGWYTPLVHILAAVTFGGWLYMGAHWQVALMNAIAVLIITCPCALGLAVPVVQVLASHKLFKSGILLKSADALERLEAVDTIVFDKTGTLTEGRMALISHDTLTPENLQLAAALAAQSRHPYSRAIAEALGGAPQPLAVTEVQGQGVEATHNGEALRLGSASFTGAASTGDAHAELWFKRGTNPPARFILKDSPRTDARETLQALARQGYALCMLTGDRAETAAAVAADIGITDVRANVNPKQKMDVLNEIIQNGRHPLMVGDGLNDAPALALATASMSPASALEITQNAADIVFQGKLLAPVATTLRIAKATQRLVKENFVMAFGYNIVAVPLAMAGHVTPLIAAVAMSSSSLAVVLNALRLNRMEG